MHLAGVSATGRKTNECPRRLTLPKPLTPAESRRQLKLLLTDMQMARSNVLESYERLLGCFCVPATTTLRRLREMARFMARREEPWLFSADAISLMHEIAFCRSPNALDALLLMKEVYLNDRGYRAGIESVLKVIRANRDPDYVADPAALMGITRHSK